MKRLLILLVLAACREDAALPPPLAMTAQSVGYFCQMNVLDHGGPKGQIALDGLPGMPLFFSQVSDTLAYLKMHEQNYRVLATYVSDMGAAPSWDHPGAANWVLIDTAVFVVGSDQPGGMDQPEVVPFADPAKAATFAAEHGGHLVSLSQLLSPTSQPTADDLTTPGDDADYSARLRALTPKSGG